MVSLNSLELLSGPRCKIIGIIAAIIAIIAIILIIIIITVVLVIKHKKNKETLVSSNQITQEKQQNKQQNKQQTSKQTTQQSKKSENSILNYIMKPFVKNFSEERKITTKDGQPLIIRSDITSTISIEPDRKQIQHSYQTQTTQQNKQQPGQIIMDTEIKDSEQPIIPKNETDKVNKQIQQTQQTQQVKQTKTSQQLINPDSKISQTKQQLIQQNKQKQSPAEQVKKMTQEEKDQNSQAFRRAFGTYAVDDFDDYKLQ